MCINLLVTSLISSWFKLSHNFPESCFTAVELYKENYLSKKSKNPLAQFALNLSDEAASGRLDRLIGRDNELSRIITVLSRRRKNNPVLIGEPGVGKTAIIEGLAQAIFNQDVPMNLINKQVYSLDMASLVAGTQ